MRIARMLALAAALCACGSDAAERVASPADLDGGERSSHRFKSRHDGSSADARDESPRAEGPRKRRRLTAEERARAARVAAAADAMLPNPTSSESCGDGDTDCMPPEHWVDKLCSGVHPELALHMFRGGSPWKRLYSRAIAPAYNGAGGPSLSDERIQRGEELIALRRNSDAKRSNAGEMSIGETAGYDLLRWNGSCVTLHDGEFSSKPPRRRLTHARVDWRALGDRVQSTLRENELISRAYLERRRECRGITLGNVTRKCEQQDKSLVAAIVNYVRAGGELPEPSESL
jgi:hypothetical protein